ncbi:hypothetical protein A7985_02940 [Pseudoalteromonas luteoviolacea]|uniref:Uncharacterized protein n=1 Tax=Pseudoalteromonas luteoviolacea TaxID=43657 RepID=A0A1C0TUD2_9GAMM|nr:hypothetical protein [Pseudoalteromonas luteoviolacea]MBQ4812916.1 hypothetical protein [Pseudoalteromonas luteoviolacea]OCQ22931.1 hypothetical protein A7985_02940 [Pseudoalteromonas luteoviolacea]
MEIKCNQVHVKARIRADQPSDATADNTNGSSQQIPAIEKHSNALGRYEVQELLCQLEADLKRHIEFRFAKFGKEKRP